MHLYLEVKLIKKKLMENCIDNENRKVFHQHLPVVDTCDSNGYTLCRCDIYTTKIIKKKKAET